MKTIRAPLNMNDIKQLEVGDEVLVQGVVYAARDAAHAAGHPVLRRYLDRLLLDA